MKREITFLPAWDKRDPDPKKNYGIHGVEIVFILRGTLGAIQFVIHSNWQLPYVAKEMRIKMKPEMYPLFEPMGADVGYHSPKPMYEGHKSTSDNCPYIGGKCYYNGSSLQAGDMLNILIAEGSDKVWRELEDHYKSIFGKLK